MTLLSAVGRTQPLLLLALLLTACGYDPAPPAPDVPSRAKVAPEQIAEAAKHGVPVAFENLGLGIAEWEIVE